MGRHTGDNEESGSLLRFLLLRAGGLALLFVAWGALVYGAIVMGPSARAGDILALCLLLVAAIGAIACLFLVLITGTQLLVLIRGEDLPPSAGGGKRARR